MRLFRRGLAVSTHAPAWGATNWIITGGWVNRFQPTPPRGGRRGVIKMIGVIIEFQPTPPRGGRHRLEAEQRREAEVSTHAPAWGATDPRDPSLIWGRFQPTPPRGGRRVPDLLDHGPTSFQPTPPRGGRRRTGFNNRKNRRFQPTPPRGGRRPRTQRPPRQGSFNPRPRVGGDHFMYTVC